MSYTSKTFVIQPPMARRIGYARAANDEFDLKQQLNELEQASCVTVYSDQAGIATAGSRSGLTECLADLGQGDVLVVSRIECIAGTLTELKEVLTRLAEHRAELRICHWDPAPTLAPVDLAEIVARLVDFEAANRREFIRAGVEVARAEGRVGGRRR